ncbi:MAG: phytoene desaturase [Deltaproteobacteria bacterium]|nr:phytoene desaturase [Deltaproteobacteria bacterium]
MQNTSSTKQRHAVVVGAGFGGLAAAVRLRAKGFHVTILEANEQPGGRAAVWQRDGFTFDAGPTVITAPYLLEELFALHGKQARDYYELVPVDPFYRVDFGDGSSFDYVGDEERLLQQIHAMSPGDVDGYRKLAAHAERIFDIGYTQLAHTPFDRVRDMLRVVPDMLRLQNYKSVFGQVSEYIQDPRLRQVFSFEPLLVGGNPLDTSSIYLLIHWLERKWGVHWAKGGTGSLVRALAKLLDELGCEIRYNSPVTEIEVRAGRAVAVHTSHGERIAADAVVCNADPSMVYSKLIEPGRRAKHTDARIAKVKQSMSLFVAYFGTNRTYPELAHHTIVLGPRYQGLLQDIFDRRVLAEDMSLYLHAPTRSDPSMAPAGHESFYVLSPIPNELAGIDWAEQQPRYLEAVLQTLEERCVPDLRKHLVTSFAVDTRHFAGRLQSMHGAAFGPQPTLTQSAWFRYHNRSEDVQGLYFVGAGTHPGAGVPGVLSSAKVLEQLIPQAELLPESAPGRPRAVPT